MNEVTIIIFGATGDLAKRKLIPALYRLLKDEKLKNYIVVGAAIDQASAPDIIKSALPFIKDPDKKILDELQAHFFYHAINFNEPADYATLNARIADLEKKHKLPGNRMIYLAAAESFYCEITHNLAASHLVKKRTADKKPWNRIVYEKPFGRDAQSALKINECIKKYFDESQIYRIDHYLTKEIVSNIALVRFTNCIFEPLWNNRYIDQVQIIVNEQIGIEGRGRYYDNYGSLADVVQNHILELLALIAMEMPEKLTGDYIRDQRVKVLQKVKVIDGMLGQYEGYKKEADIKPDSNTDTFAALYLRIENNRWSGVPFYVKTGKFLEEKETVIYLKFKQVDCLLTHSCPVPANWLKIEISPEAIFALTLNAKKPGRSLEVMPVAMEFCHSCLFGAVTPDSYEIILEEVAYGEHAISVRTDEIDYAWRIIEQIKKMALPLYEYKRKSNGPEQLVTEFEDKHGMRWKA